MKEIVILGGGASGMAAAIRAAEDQTRHVTLIERQARVGKKLAATGNGRCNLTNLNADASHYHGASPDFVLPALRHYPPERVLEFFSSLGLRTVTEYGGRVYPLSDHAGRVLDVLRLGLEAAGVTVLTAAPAQSLCRKNGRFLIQTPEAAIPADALILACGGCAGTKLGGVMDGYALAAALGHSRTALYPALTQLRTAPDYPRALKGIRVNAAIRLLQGEKVLAETRGDVLFTETGLSGTAVFELTRHAAGKTNLTAELCLFDEAEEELLRDLRARQTRWPDMEANRVLTGAVQSRLGQMLCRYAGLSGAERLSAVSGEKLRALAAALRSMRLPVTGVSGFETAQVTAGGLRTDEFDPETLQSRLTPGLYACGEVLDVDGDCGGYNLQWAWASGLLAGELR